MANPGQSPGSEFFWKKHFAVGEKIHRKTPGSTLKLKMSRLNKSVPFDPDEGGRGKWQDPRSTKKKAGGQQKANG